MLGRKPQPDPAREQDTATRTAYLEVVRLARAFEVAASIFVEAYLDLLSGVRKAEALASANPRCRPDLEAYNFRRVVAREIARHRNGADPDDMPPDGDEFGEGGKISKASQPLSDWFRARARAVFPSL